MFIVEWDLTGKKEEAEIWKMLWVQLKHLTWLGKATFAANANIDRESALVLTEKVMLKMLAAASRVYDVSEQEELSRKCILHALRDKHCFLYDSLLRERFFNVQDHRSVLTSCTPIVYLYTGNHKRTLFSSLRR